MSEILKAMATSGAVLVPIVVLVIIVSIIAVKRGEISMGGGAHGHGLAVEHVGGGAAAVAAPAAKKAPVEDTSVLLILGLGTAVFVVSVLILLATSIIAHSR